MLVAFLNERDKTGAIVAAYVSRESVNGWRCVAGDLVFSDDGKIDQGSDWLFDWEKADPQCYARKAQRIGLSIKGFSLRPMHDRHGRRPA